ncbi:hypothetical protein ATANTOWER_003587 [Ataeniobius toweri]|uniref:Secreted protein n=1 Tax=Ataeniobius toweri TaxID=208326 RepID=A0ABU7BE55_9TELE|nr:hypothetical protein [Ataeniobius toweri]
MTTANTDRMRSPFCLSTFLTLTHTASKATAIVSYCPLVIHKCVSSKALNSRHPRPPCSTHQEPCVHSSTAWGEGRAGKPYPNGLTSTILLECRCIKQVRSWIIDL